VDAGTNGSSGSGSGGGGSSSGNSGVVRQAARSTLDRLALYLQYPNTPALVRYVVVKFRPSSSSLIPFVFLGVLHVLFLFNVCVCLFQL
jgi:hypothetical protein